MGGVGKTTMAMHINNKCLKPNPVFDKVYYVTVSRDTSVYKLQHDFAIALDIKLKYEDKAMRAATLGDTLKRRGKCLLILDDVWEHISMDKVGVSAERNGCKLLITTRKLDVIQRMNCVAVKLEPLTEDESWDLFVKKLGDYEALSEEAKHTARSVAKECGRLPLAIITVAGAMRGERCEHVWRDALRTLKCIESSSQIDMEEKVYSVLMFSYDRLKDDRHRKCFLHCALYLEDYWIKREELIRMLIAVGLVDGGNNRRENIDKGDTMLNHLVKASLLEEDPTPWANNYSVIKHDWRYVKMHDLLRDMALREIGASGIVKAGNRLTHVPPEVEWNNENLELVSLMENEIEDCEGVESPNCPKVSVLLLEWNPMTSIPDSFFVQMIGLKVLNLSGTAIEVLPGSVSGLVNLNSLLLPHCGCLRFIPSLAKLTSLREINIRGCRRMEKVPDGMEELVSLEYLNFRGSGITGLHSRTFRKLGNLQVLLINYFMFVPRLGERSFADVTRFNQCVEADCFGPNQHPRLTDYFVTVGPEDIVGDPYNRIICVTRYYWSIVIERHLLLPPSVEFLRFRECDFGGGSLLGAVPSLFHVTKLECYELISCEGVEYIIPVPDEWSIPPFLEGMQVLRLMKLYDFGGLIRRRGVRDHGYNISFSGLRRLVIEGCPKVERLWLTNLDLPNLEDILIQDCERMEEIFATAKGEPIRLPKLCRLELSGLPKLRSLWCDNDVLFQGIQELQLIDLNEPGGLIRRGGVRDHGYNISFGGLRTLVIHRCPKLERLWLLNVELPNLEDILIQDCEKMEEIFATAKGEPIRLPKLCRLKLSGLPELRSLWCDNDVLFQGIQELQLIDLNEPGGLIRRGGVRDHGYNISFGGLRLWLLNVELPNLEYIHIDRCDKMKEIFTNAEGETITLPKLRKLELVGLPELRSIWCDNDVSFPNLLKIILDSCREVRELGFTSFNMPSLESIVIQNCTKMKEIFTVQDEIGDGTIVEMPNLKELVLGNVPELRSICRSTIVCNSLQLMSYATASIFTDGKVSLKSCPISIPRLLEGNNTDYSPPRLEAGGYWDRMSADWWESLDWNDPATKDRLHQLGCFSV